MQIRCYRCGWNFGISNEEVSFARDTLASSSASHYDARCPRCRIVNRIPGEQIRRAAPKPSAAEPPAPQPSPPAEP